MRDVAQILQLISSMLITVPFVIREMIVASFPLLSSREPLKIIILIYFMVR